ncbi:MAG: radical SAM protein [Phycisphaerales bacterium]|nr:MAG: radical SAM protein [Phycisphaerales bacterium]
MRPLTYRIRTLGCRVNHAESREIETLLRERGLVAAERRAPADLEVIHTCSVTQAAAAKSRQTIRRAAKQAVHTPSIGDPSGLIHNHIPGDGGHEPPVSPKILVTGCYASTNPCEAATLVGEQSVIAHHDDSNSALLIERLARQLDDWLNNHPRLSMLRGSDGESSPFHRRNHPPARIHRLPVVPPQGRSQGRGQTSSNGAARHIRAELRIQDGCDAHCTFCIIPKIRKTLRSKSISDAVEEARQLVDLGHKEIVLTGIFIGAFGHETALRRKQTHRHAHPLADLVDAVAQVYGLQRLRLSSMEPGDCSEPLLDAMLANQPVVVPHLHLPLQSGSDRILRRMNRQYTVADYLEMIDQVNQSLTADGLPPAITTDIICGFPGETEADFAATQSVAERVGYLHMHVFPFSPRSGTAAARWTDRFIDDRTRKVRVRSLIDRELDPEVGLAIRYLRRLRGRTVRVILEQPVKGRPGWMSGRCDHYAEIQVPTDRPRGTLMYCTVTEVSPSRVVGQPVRDAHPLPVLTPA